MPDTALSSPLLSLQQGHWFKLICGASFQHLPAVRTLALVYALAGADCIDVAADPAVIHAARSGILAAQKIWPCSVWLMVSLNDGEDPHFRKAFFDPQRCPTDCPRPCVPICPAQAIDFSAEFAGVRDEKCYGCGRCLPVCPIEQIETRSQPATLDAVSPLISSGQVTALELHTQLGHEAEFQLLWQKVRPFLEKLSVLSISCPDGTDIIPYLKRLQSYLLPLSCPLIWQTDGRPMSGDIGKGTTRAALQYGEKVLQSDLKGFVQLAGGTNLHTVSKLTEEPRQGPRVSGIAFGSYARSQIQALQLQLEAERESSYRLEDYPHLLAQGLALAEKLVVPVKELKLRN